MSKRAAIALLAGSLLLAGCSTAPVIDREAVYLKLVHDKTTNTSTDAKLIETARAACDALESGSTMKDLQNTVAQTKFTQSTKVELARIVGFGIGVYCPEFR